nr:hypothetical protein DCAR_008443 [Ipomoea trifida]
MCIASSDQIPWRNLNIPTHKKRRCRRSKFQVHSLTRYTVQKRRGGEEDEEIEVMNLELYLKNISMMKENEMLRKKANLLHQENLALLSLFQQSDSAAAAAVASPESFLTFC